MEREREEFESKLAEQQAKMEAKQKEIELLKTTPHILNINADPTMTGMIKKAFNQGENVIGKSTKDFQPDIAISGVGISNRHCVVTFDQNTRQTVVLPNTEDPDKFQIKVNGQPVVAEPVPLNHGDRLLVGTHHYYLYVDPEINPDEIFEWGEAMKEANADQMKMLDQDNGELEKIKQ